MGDNPQVNIYIETTVHGPAQHGGRYMYLLECTGADGAPRTRQAAGSWQDEKENCLALQALAAALERLRMPCVIDLYTACTLIRNAVDNGWVDAWIRQDWKNGKGQPVKHRELWERIAAKLGEHLVFVHAGEHPYRNWMQTEMRNEEEAMELKERRKGNAV